MKEKSLLVSHCGIKECMMSAFFFFLASMALCQAPGPALSTEIYRLDNGLTVYLNEDHTLPSVFGAVAVKGGSKRDPADATGIAHYFEHIMFKGTDSIGTLDYQAEKVYLDSIAVLYDELALAAGEEQKEKIQMQINRLSVKSSEFAIPNEFGKILGEMGGTMVNAGTSNEDIVYFNIFPANQVEKWLKLYSHRFIHPVYRLFQSELETVYEEYNMYKDNRFSNAYEKFIREFFPSHPYGVPVIGYPEHLKNPSMRKMDEYYNTYYVANNMALVLSGNFDTEEIKPMISQYFGVWRSGNVPPMDSSYSIVPFEGRNVFQAKLTPVKFGLRAYRSVPLGHEDEPALDMINSLMSNQALTGLMDKLYVDHKVMSAATTGMYYLDAGGEIVIFVPKIFGQSLKKAERIVMAQIDSLKSGKFSDELLEAVKTDYIVNYERGFENQNNRGFMMVTAFCQERDWLDVFNYPEKIKKVNRVDIIRVANTYFGDDYLVCYSKTGFPRKPEMLKPSFKPIPAINTEKKSAYAMQMEKMPVLDLEPDFIEFGPPGLSTNEVTIHDITPLAHLYYTENKVNDLFELRINFGIGTYDKPVLRQLADYMPLVGSDSMSLTEISGGLQKLGASYYFYATRDNFVISISGLDQNLDEILALVTELLYHPAADDKKVDNLVEDVKAAEKVQKDDPETVGSALYNYAVYGEHSSYLNRLNAKAVKKLKAETLVRDLKAVMQYEADIHYSGKLPISDLEGMLKSRLQLDSIKQVSKSPVKNEFKEYGGPVVFFLDDKKAIQSKDYFFIPGDVLTEEDKPYLNAYAEYLDGGMQSVIFQEIRELRSFAYASGAGIHRPFYKDERTSLSAYVGTQADKTQEAVEVMYNILSTPPDKPDRIDIVRKALVQSVNSDKPGFRSVSQQAASYHRQHYSADPRIEFVEAYKKMGFEDMVDLYKRQFYNKPAIITIIGDESKIGTDWMAKYGKVIKVKIEDIFNW